MELTEEEIGLAHFALIELLERTEKALASNDLGVLGRINCQRAKIDINELLVKLEN